MPSPSVEKLGKYIQRLRVLRTKLDSNGREFWKARRESYRELCAAIVEQQILLVRPQDEGYGQWAAQARLLADAVATRQFEDGDRASLLIFVASQNLRPLAGPLEDVLTFDTVRQWVKAGRHGDPMGKDFNDEDHRRSDEGIAWLVWLAIMQRKATTTYHALQRWMEERSLAHFAAYLEPILAIWKAALIDRVNDDLRAWLRLAATLPR